MHVLLYALAFFVAVMRWMLEQYNCSSVNLSVLRSIRVSIPRFSTVIPRFWRAFRDFERVFRDSSALSAISSVYSAIRAIFPRFAEFILSTVINQLHQTICFRSGRAAEMNKIIAVSRCMIIPTNGIHPIMDVMIPNTLPIIEPLSLFVIINVMICKISITNSGVHAFARIYAPPRNGMPSNASNIPVIHLKMRDIDKIAPPSLHSFIFKLSSTRISSFYYSLF